MHLIFSALLFVPVFLINLAHLRARRIPLYTWGSVIAIFHATLGFLSFILLPFAAIFVSIMIEVVVALMNSEERKGMEVKYLNEIKETEEQIAEAQESYNKLFCLASFTVEQEFIYRNALDALERNGIWHYVRNGLITSILVKPEDSNRAMEILGIDDSTDA